MKQVVKLSVFILLVTGTLGLLINEFIFNWGSTATLTFAALNVVGLAIPVDCCRDPLSTNNEWLGSLESNRKYFEGFTGISYSIFWKDAHSLFGSKPTL
jgi:hypothetical protein